MKCKSNLYVVPDELVGKQCKTIHTHTCRCSWLVVKKRREGKGDGYNWLSWLRMSRLRMNTCVHPHKLDCCCSSYTTNDHFNAMLMMTCESLVCLCWITYWSTPETRFSLPFISPCHHCCSTTAAERDQWWGWLGIQATVVQGIWHGGDIHIRKHLLLIVIPRSISRTWLYPVSSFPHSFWFFVTSKSANILRLWTRKSWLSQVSISAHAH